MDGVQADRISGSSLSGILLALCFLFLLFSGCETPGPLLNMRGGNREANRLTFRSTDSLMKVTISGRGPRHSISPLGIHLFFEITPEDTNHDFVVNPAEVFALFQSRPMRLGYVWIGTDKGVILFSENRVSDTMIQLSPHRDYTVEYSFGNEGELRQQDNGYIDDTIKIVCRDFLVIDNQPMHFDTLYTKMPYLIK